MKFILVAVLLLTSNYTKAIIEDNCVHEVLLGLANSEVKETRLGKILEKPLTDKDKKKFISDWNRIDNKVKKISKKQLMEISINNLYLDKKNSTTVRSGPIKFLTGTARKADENWGKATKYMLREIDSQNDITLIEIKKLNQLLNYKLRSNGLAPGKFRYIDGNHNAWTSSGDYIKVMEVNTEMQAIIDWYKKKKSIHSIELAARMYQRLISIHPFGDGNGRTSRLIMNWILLRNGYPAIVLGKENQKAAFFLNRNNNISTRNLIRIITDKIDENLHDF